MAALVTLLAFVLVFFLFIVLPLSLFTVRQKSRFIIQRFGKHLKVATPGLNVKIPFIDQIAARMEMRILELIVKVETKTSDNVFVNMAIAVQYQIVDPERAFYELVDPTSQIESYVFDVVRAQVPLLSLDKVYETKDEVADAVKTELSAAMDDFGYKIIKALVTDIDPDTRVKHAMNEINATDRLKIAAENEAEADKIRVVKAAEAQADSKRLQGEGIAQQRMAIADGLRQSTQMIKEGLGGSNEEDVMKVLLLTQHYDTMEAMAKQQGTKIMFVDQSPAALHNASSQIARGVILGNEAVTHDATGPEGTPPNVDKW